MVRKFFHILLKHDVSIDLSGRAPRRFIVSQRIMSNDKRLFSNWWN